MASHVSSSGAVDHRANVSEPMGMGTGPVGCSGAMMRHGSLRGESLVVVCVKICGG